MIQSLSMIDPVMLIQYIQVQLRVHPFSRTPGRKGPTPSHQRIEDGKSVEVYVVVGGAFHRHGNVGEFGQTVGTNDGSTFTWYL